MTQLRTVAATIPAQDLGRATRFYKETFGLTPSEENGRQARFPIGGGEFILFTSTGKASGEHTQLGFQVDDLQGLVEDLHAQGVSFEQYNMPGLKTVNGIAEIRDGERAAWLKDPEGNLIVIAEVSR